MDYESKQFSFTISVANINYEITLTCAFGDAFAGAQDIVREHAIHSPFDIDAQALRLSFLLMSMDTEDLSDKEVKETCLKIVETCKLLLVLDSDCVQTIQGTLDSCHLIEFEH